MPNVDYSSILDTFSTEQLEEELEKRKALPEEINFKFYLHNNYELSEIVEVFENQTGYLISDDLARKISNTFYEVALSCKLNTITGEITYQ